MSYNVVVTKGAHLEYLQIINYHVNVLKNKKAANDFSLEFNKKIALIKDNPLLFSKSRLKELAKKEYRSFLVKNYIVIYKIKDDTIYIAHIFHQTQNYANLV